MRETPRYRLDLLGIHRSPLALLTVLALGCLIASGQSPADKPAPPAQEAAKPADTSQGEVVTRDSNPAFKVRVNLVLVRVVVRDSRGNVVEGLKKEDFLLFDNRKPQTISSFSVETPLSQTVPVVSVSDRAGEAEGAAAPALPQRFVSLLFDDIHMAMEDAVTVRVAAGRILDSLAASDRVGIFTTSGQVGQEFTADREALRESLNRIVARPLPQSELRDCPDVGYYQAVLIENQHDDQALAVATEDAVQCAFNGDESKINLARPMAQAAAARALSGGDIASEYAYSHMQDALRRLANMPGQRKLVFISPGFLMSTLFSERADAIDRSTRAGIVIDTLDVRGLYTPDVSGDITRPPRDSFRTAGHKLSYRVAAQSAQSEILQDLPLGTGGSYYQNRNDLDVALRESIAAPKTTYLLGFSPQNLKLNGSFHSLKVSLTGKLKYNVLARRGYYAPRTLKTPEETAKAEIQEAVFSQEEIRDLAVDLQTQFFRKEGTETRLSVLAHVDLKSLKFRKVEGRNHDDLTLATVIFDENGNYVTGGEKVLEMKLRDATLERLDRSGITVKSSFDIKPGNYLVRLVVRDREGELMAARNGAVVIPY